MLWLQAPVGSADGFAWQLSFGSTVGRRSSYAVEPADSANSGCGRTTVEAEAAEGFDSGTFGVALTLERIESGSSVVVDPWDVSRLDEARGLTYANCELTVLHARACRALHPTARQGEAVAADEICT